MKRIYNKVILAFSSIYFAFILWLPDEYSKYRVRYYNKQNCRIHKNSSISSNVRIRGKFELGEGSSIAQNCSISGENVGVRIGNNVMIAPNVVIVAFNHGFERLDLSMSKQTNEEASILINDDVWIGANCTITKGVTIGKGSIIRFKLSSK